MPCRTNICAALRNKDTVLGAKTLSTFASVYQVHRSLQGEKDARLTAAFEELSQLPEVRVDALADDPGCQPTFDLVCNYASRLKQRYAGTADSAATKFLWLRFRAPIRIYDSRTWRWLTKHDPKLKEVDEEKNIEVWYPRFYEAWGKAYREKQKQRLVTDACERLSCLNYLTDVSHDQQGLLSSWITSNWFHERVLDRYMLLHADE